MKRIKLIELIKEIIQEAEVEKATIGDLEFGKNVFEKDVITNGSYNLVINNAENLESWKLGKLNLIIFEEEKKKGVPSEELNQKMADDEEREKLKAEYRPVLDKVEVFITRKPDPGKPNISVPKRIPKEDWMAAAIERDRERARSQGRPFWTGD